MLSYKFQCFQCFFYIICKKECIDIKYLKEKSNKKLYDLLKIIKKE